MADTKPVGVDCGGVGTQYCPQTAERSDFSTQWLEETHTGGVAPELLEAVRRQGPGTVRDADADGYLEVQRFALERAIAQGDRSCRHLPVAPYFADPAPRSAAGVGAAGTGTAPEIDRLDHLPTELRDAVRRYDIAAATRFFQTLSRESLYVIGDELAGYLAAMGAHAGMDVDDRVTIDDPRGFSVERGGRLRLDCGLFVDLAQRVLAGQSDLRFQIIDLDQGAEAPAQSSPPQRVGSQVPPSAAPAPPPIRSALLFCYQADGCPDLTKIPCDAYSLSLDYVATGERRVVPAGEAAAVEQHLGWSVPLTVDDAAAWHHAHHIDFRSPPDIQYYGTRLTCLRRGDTPHALRSGTVHGQSIAASAVRRVLDRVPPTWEAQREALRSESTTYRPYVLAYDPHDRETASYDVPAPAVMETADAHRILLVSAGTAHLVVDNHTVTAFTGDDPLAFVQSLYATSYDRVLVR